jgi:hypothetical protein
MSARGPQVAVAWFTMGSKSKAEVRLAISTDAGASFGAPLTVDDAQPMGRTDVTHLADGSLLVVWLGQGEDDGELRARRYLANGTASQTITVGKMGLSRRAGFPRVAALARGAVVAWTDPKSGVKVARIKVR